MTELDVFQRRFEISAFTKLRWSGDLRKAKIFASATEWRLCKVTIRNLSKTSTFGSCEGLGPLKWIRQARVSVTAPVLHLIHHICYLYYTHISSIHIDHISTNCDVPTDRIEVWKYSAKKYCCTTLTNTTHSPYSCSRSTVHYISSMAMFSQNPLMNGPNYSFNQAPQAAAGGYTQHSFNPYVR